LKMMNIKLSVCFLFFPTIFSELSICNSLHKSLNKTHGSITFQNRLNSFQVSRGSENDTIHYQINCAKKLDNIQKKIHAKVSYTCSKDIITSLIVELGKAFRKPSMSISTDILCAFYSGISEGCPANLFDGLMTHTLDMLTHVFHEDCVNKYKHVLQTQVEFWHTTTINNIRYLDIFIALSLFLFWVFINFTNFKKLTVRFKIVIIQHIFYTVAYTLNIISIVLTAFVITFVSTVSFPYTFSELLPSVQTNTSKKEKTLQKKSKSKFSDTPYNSSLCNNEFQYMEACLDDDMDKLSTSFPEFIMTDDTERLQIIHNFTKFTKIHAKVHMVVVIFFNVLYIFLTSTYILFFFKNI
jgi:hypothetical protein